MKNKRNLSITWLLLRNCKHADMTIFHSRDNKELQILFQTSKNLDIKFTVKIGCSDRLFYVTVANAHRSLNYQSICTTR